LFGDIGASDTREAEASGVVLVIARPWIIALDATGVIGILLKVLPSSTGIISFGGVAVDSIIFVVVGNSSME
jgi:hypothetical protein